ncbi:OsmC family protein [Bdellovibrio reynosensis]|uniref:OsmC family protein n=1 Tax=Bdellovibrio reynosensis TaxID=2835041 RepID=A0ABY4CA72_9BACT|nr:OsmC family protein [Bdellovibrio reynosensis]UOF01867.1 OsmC family protein [Bdellovibrio reynosensis]
MAHMRSQTKWLGQDRGIAFEATLRGHKLVMDTRAEGGGDTGPSPKELLLASICGCTAMDVVSILQKMRVHLESCEVNSETATTAGYPSIFSEVKLQYLISGEGIKAEQVIKAVTLSMTKYCGVSAMIVKASPMTYEIVLNGTKVGEGKADFQAAAEHP